MEFVFDTREKYLGFLKNLNKVCDSLWIVEDLDLSPKFWEGIKPLVNECCWTRKFPGWGRGCNMKVIKLPLNNGVMNVLSEYNSFLEIGYDAEEEMGLDMAFFKDGKVVFIIINHEDMCYLEEKFLPYFRETIKSLNIRRR